jgi:hypothetical protein
MSGPFESLDIDGLDDSVVCVDGVCAVPLTAQMGYEDFGVREDPAPEARMEGFSPRSAEGFDEQGVGVVGERDLGGEDERVG